MGVTDQLLNVDELDLSDSEDSEDEALDAGPETMEAVVDNEAVEVFKERTIEDIIEEQRAKLAAQGKVGTPVTEASFAVW